MTLHTISLDFQNLTNKSKLSLINMKIIVNKNKHIFFFFLVKFLLNASLWYGVLTKKKKKKFMYNFRLELYILSY